MSNRKIYSFQSEIKQLLNLMINSLYSNKEIFLRELISNSSDAIDKLRFYYISKGNEFNNISYSIRISIDKRNSLVMVSDNGIGMSKKEIINNLGTIAKSGTKEFFKKLNLVDKNKNSNIGQFGVGFYSSFMVSDEVKVITRSIDELNENNSILWKSNGLGQYSVENVVKSNVGTDVILHIKDNCRDYLNESTLCNIIVKYSNHINIPIEFKKYDKDKKIYVWKKINKSDSLWVKNKSDITDKEYIDFYKSVSNNLGNPLIWTHNHVEGKLNYISLLYIPDTSSWDIWNREDYKNGIKLYVCKVFIMDDVKKLLPYYLRFTQGIIDTSDLPLNVSREFLQDDVVLSSLKFSITKRILKMLEILSKDKVKYDCFWKQFGFVFKEGLAEDQVNKHIISLLLRFNSTRYDNSDKFVSLEDYLLKMKPGQDKIFFITSDNYLIAKSSPHLEIYNNKGIEVLLLCDKIDEWMMTYLLDFKGIKFISITKNVDLDKLFCSDVKSKIIKSSDLESTSLIGRIKEVLFDLVKDVKISNRLENFPVILTTDSSEMSTQMVKLLASAGKKVPKIKYLFEINMDHNLIRYIKTINDKVLFSKWVLYIYYQALFVESGTLDNPVEFINISNYLFSFLVTNV